MRQNEHNGGLLTKGERSMSKTLWQVNPKRALEQAVVVERPVGTMFKSLTFDRLVNLMHSLQKEI